MDAAVLVAKCQNTKQTFGMRAEKKGRGWELTWAFPIREQSAKRENYPTSVSGQIDFSDEYPGCPYCERSGFVHCICGKIACYGGEESYTCPWCGHTGGVTTTSEFNLSGSDM